MDLMCFVCICMLLLLHPVVTCPRGLLPHSGAAGGGLHLDGVQDLLGHLEELLAPPPLARLGPAHGVAPRWQELQDVDLKDGPFHSYLPFQ